MNRNKIILYFFFNIVIGLLASSWQRLAPFLRADRIDCSCENNFLPSTSSRSQNLRFREWQYIGMQGSLSE